MSAPAALPVTGRNVTLAMPQPVTIGHVCPKCFGVGSGTGRHETHRASCEDYRPVARHGLVYCPQCLRQVRVDNGTVGAHSHVLCPGTECSGTGRAVIGR